MLDTRQKERCNNLKNQDNSVIYFLNDIKDEIDQFSKATSTAKMLDIKNLIEEFFTKGRSLSSMQTGLSPETIINLETRKLQHEDEDDKQYSRRIKHLSSQVSNLWLEEIRKRWGKIDNILDSRDRIKKLIQLLICNSNASGYEMLLKPPTGQSLIGDYRTNSSINRHLRTALMRFNDNDLAEIELCEPYFSKLFQNKDFAYFIEQKSKSLGVHIYNYIEQLKCIYDSITRFEHLRIYIDLTHRQELKNGKETYEKILEEYHVYEKKLLDINKALAGIQNPRQAALKEFITKEGFSITQNTGSSILLSSKEQAITEGIGRIKRNSHQSKFRKADKQVEKNFLVYDFLDIGLNPCDFIEKKTDTINKLVGDFIISETATKIIASNKNLKRTKSTRQMTVRMPKPIITKITRLAKKNNISERCLSS